MATRVLIVGAGLAGLSCARTLAEAGLEARILESEDGVGGRVRTDVVDGFRLDRGFQVLLTAYPEAKLQLDYRALSLGTFLPGARLRHGGRFYEVADPWRRPRSALSGLFAPIGSLGDKLRVAALRRRVLRASIAELFARPESSTLVALRAAGFSESMIERFFRPFLAGIFLDEELETSSRMLDFVFKMFSEGHAALPALGMGEIPRQMAGRLPEGSIRTGASVRSVGERHLVLDDGSRLEGDAVVVACSTALVPGLVPGLEAAAWRSVFCFYWSAPEAPVEDPILLLRGEERGLVNNFCVPSQVAPSYAPEGRALMSASVLGAHRPPSGDPRDLEPEVRRQLAGWFGDIVDRWQLIRVYDIPRALPSSTSLDPPQRPIRAGSRLWVCGDHRDDPSIQGALVSGRRTAEDVLETLGGGSTRQ